MIYRSLGTTGIQVSEIGLGCEHLQGKARNELCRVLDLAMEGGVNCLDVFMSEPHVRENIGYALKGRRERMVVQGHIGTLWFNGQYEKSRDLSLCRKFFEDLLFRMQTDYIDVAMLHYVDTEEQLSLVLDNGLLDYAQNLKEKGVVRAIGMSSHDPVLARKAVEMGILDVLMFSANPAFDMIPRAYFPDGIYCDPAYRPAGEVFFQLPERSALYDACVKYGVGITVMKPLAAGTLLSPATSPFGAALTVAQCLHYALSQPAVASVLIGCKDPEEMACALAYEDATPKERDYTQVVTEPSFSLKGHCMYCNHCLPCPVALDVAQINKFYDMAQVAEDADSLREHYASLPHHAGECLACGSCEQNCPFEVAVIQRMRAAKAFFGK